MKKLSIGDWHPIITSRGLGVTFSQQEDFRHEWSVPWPEKGVSTAKQDLLKNFATTYVDILLVHHSCPDNEVRCFMKKMAKEAPVKFALVITSTSMLNAEAVQELVNLGAQSFLHIPSTDKETQSFLMKLREVATGKFIVDPEVLKPEAVETLEIRTQTVISKEQPVGEQYLVTT